MSNTKGEFDDLLDGVIEEVPVEYNEFLSVEQSPPADVFQAFSDNEQMARFIAQTMRVPYEAVSDAIINQGYAAVLWKFREAALLGDIDRTRSLKLWLEWAQPHMDKPKSEETGPRNQLAVAFLPRDVKPVQ